MAKPNEFASVLIDVDAGAEPATRTRLETPDSDTPFRILVLGDFSGRANRRTETSTRHHPVQIDRDNFDEVLASLNVGLKLGGEGARRIALKFTELEDFHPDRIYQHNELFQPLWDLRRKLNDPDTFTEAAAEVAAWSGLTVPVQPVRAGRLPETSAAPPDLAPLTNGNLLDNILDASESQPLAPSESRDPLRSFINRALAPHVQPREAPQLPALLAEVDEAAGKLMRAILHHEDFQALEAAWRALFLLVRGLETGTQLKVYVLDLTKAELAGGWRGPDDDGWAMVAANFSFNRSADDVVTLRLLGQLMSAAGAPLIAEADLGGEAEADGPWAQLRRSPEAAWLGLALPRFLLRLPYGAGTDQLEAFRFEEMPGPPAHRDYLWGNPSFACAYLLGETFSQQGWQLRPGSHQEISGLPLHVYEEAGESRLRPCIELPMTTDDVDWALEQGYMPLIWKHGQDSIRLVRFQSIADPPARLAGRWD